MASSEDTEITLGVGKLLGLFFLLAAICGVFFSIGYSLGRSAGREQAANDQAAQVDAASDATPANSATSEPKPSAAVAKPQEQPAASAPQNDLTFYKAVQQSDQDVEKPATPSGSSPAGAAPKVAAVTASSAKVSPTTPPTTATAQSNKDVVSHTSPVTGPGTIVVQIAALTREDDAVSLAGALRKKNYNVFVVNNPVNNDKFYHVQVGPFSTLAEAEAMKAKLVAEGYNPIIKK
jgi:DedD protein